MAFSYKFLWITCIISVGLGVTIYFFAPLYSIEGFEKALDGVLLLSSISLGFYGACLGVFASIFNTKVVKELMSDNDYKKEFITVSLITLGSSFLTVFTTIFYQVILANNNIGDLFYKITNAIWATFTISFILYNVMFVLVIFMIFFSNTDEKNNSALNVVNGKTK